MDNEKLDRYIRTVGKRTFINCFYLFKNNYKTMNSIELGKCIPEYDSLDASNSATSLKWKASAAIGIFNNGREYDAIKLCLDSARLEEELIQRAKKILEDQENNFDNYQLKIEKTIYYEGINYKKKLEKSKKIKINSKHYLRDPQVAAYAKQQANYACEFDIRHETFISEISNKQYIEAHHLIPMKYQEQFEYPLDIPENIVALCPNCHRAIHHGIKQQKNEIISKLFNTRKKSLQDNGLNIDIIKLLKMYN